MTGIGVLWVNGAFWFETGERSRKGRNLHRDPRCVLRVATHESTLWWTGRPRTSPNPATVADLAERWAADDWPARPDDTGEAVTTEYSAPSAGPPPWHDYRLMPHTATAVGTVEPHGATRWRF